MNATTNLPPKLELKINLTDKQFWQLCHDNGEFQFEHTAQGEVIIMPPTGGNTSRRNIKIATQLENWSRQNNLGETFDSNGGFKLPNGANRSPDACWVKRDHWEALTQNNKKILCLYVPILWWNCALLVMPSKLYKIKCKNTSTTVLNWLG